MKVTETTFSTDEQGQLTLRFDRGYADAYPTLKQFIGYRVHHQGKPQKAVAADMDLAPSMLSRKVADTGKDTCNLTCDDLERFIDTQGDHSPIFYLLEKFVLASTDDQIEALQRRIAELEANKKASDPAPLRGRGAR